MPDKDTWNDARTQTQTQAKAKTKTTTTNFQRITGYCGELINIRLQEGSRSKVPHTSPHLKEEEEEEEEGG
ncbi:hypothetical protein E2C01_091285 [Portunus trituberculatus]|uniref:Uncharacterized protein n=1 Tax=Portunus trituberculatus TaxID=210409 RepID=A0A5B7JMJ4_PORTR|nr:hypothetical protein [Portunus trituberculatus]